MATGERKDPYFSYKFQVQIEEITVAGFSEVSGLGIQTEVERRMFGGENDLEYTFIKGTKYSDLSLKRGVSDSELWDWYYNVIHGKIKRKSGSISICDHVGNVVAQWYFLDAIPIKWDGPVLNASSSTVAVENMVLAHHGLYKE